MNKKGLVKTILIIILIVFALSYFGYKIVIDKLDYKEICEEKYSQYELKFCVENIKGIKMCDRVSMDFVRTEFNLLSSDIYVCIDEGGEIYKL